MTVSSFSTVSFAADSVSPFGSEDVGTGSRWAMQQASHPQSEAHRHEVPRAAHGDSREYGVAIVSIVIA